MVTWLFRVARAWVAAGHLIALSNGVFVVIVLVFLVRNPYVGMSLQQADVSIPHYYVPVIITASIGCLGHLALISHSILLSLQRLKRSRSNVAPAASLVAAIPKPRSINVAPLELPRPRSWRNRLSSAIERRANRMQAVWIAYHPEFTRFFILWEVSLQTFQANKISYLIASKWINRLMALVLVLNCWFAPVIHHILRHHPPAFVRLCRSLVDSVIDVAYGIGIPLTIFYPYYRDYDGSISLFPVDFYHRDTWYISAISELRQVFATGKVDMISKSTGSLAFTFRLFLVQRAIAKAEREATSETSSSPVVLVREVKTRLRRLLDMVLMLWGGCVLALHVHATVTSVSKHNSGCLLELRPWGVTSYTCAALEISCSKWHTDGEKARMHQLLELVDPHSVQILILSNCRELALPSRVQSLANLLTLKIYNSSIIDWGSDAALRQEYHPLMQTVALVRVNMTEMPEGLLADDFPNTIWAVYLSNTNLVDYPDKMATVWTGVQMVSVDGNPTITDIPIVLPRLPSLRTLGFRGTNLQAVSSRALEDAKLMFFDLAGNPLTELPGSMGDPTRLTVLDFRKTKISRFPMSWFLFQPSHPVYFQAAATPLCSGWASENQSTPSWLIVDCFTGANADVTHFYPVAEEDQWRRANQ